MQHDKPKPSSESQYFSDNDIASLLSVSSSWVRKQRHLRQKGKEHNLTIDPVYIGNSLRYKCSEVSSWLATL
jgi:hypothetical protein